MNFIRKYHLYILWCIPIISFLLHARVFNLDLVGIHVWRQTETQTVINNFFTEDFNILRPHINDHADTDRILRMEFPLMQWLFALPYKIFGYHIFITRILCFIVSLFSTFGIYSLVNKLFKNETIATLSAWCFTFSPVFYYYTMNPIPDNLALCLIIWSMSFLYSYANDKRFWSLLWSAILFGLSVLVKLPFILYGTFIFFFLAIKIKQRTFLLKDVVSSVAAYTIFLLPAISWYIMVIPHWQNGVAKGILNAKQSKSELIDIILGNLFSVLPELLVNYGSLLFFLAGLFLIFRNKIYQKKSFNPFLFTGIIILLYFLFEMNMITTVHDYYLFPFLPMIFIIIGYGAYLMLSYENKYLTALSILCLIILPLTAFLRIDSRWDTNDPGFNPAYLKYNIELRNITPKDALCVVGYDDSHYILLYYIDRKGWAFDRNWMDGDLLAHYRRKGASYIFLDNGLDTVRGIKSQLGKLVFNRDSLKVYNLKPL